MISATHHIECITVKKGPAHTVTCGGCTLTDYGSWTINAFRKQWFNDRQTFRPGEFRITYLGGRRVIRRACTGDGDFSWHIQQVAEPISSVGSIDFTKWSVKNYGITGVDPNSGSPGGGRPDQWQLDSDGATQLLNGQPTLLASDTDLIDNAFNVNIRVGDPQQESYRDDDIFGVAWGFSSVDAKPNNYYALIWQGTGHNNKGGYGPRLIRVVNSASLPVDLTKKHLYDGDNWTSGNGQIIVVARGPKVDWDFNKNYTFSVTYKSDGTSIYSITSGATVIWQGTYKDLQPLGTGKIAFFNQSQEQTRYTTQTTGTSQVIYNSPNGRMCVADRETIYFDGQSEDVVILCHERDTVTAEYSGIAGDPVTVTLPEKHILFEDTSNYLIGTPSGTPGAPVTAEKIFNAGSGSEMITHTIPKGTLINRGTGHVSDFADSGFTVKQWGQNISVSELIANGWIDRDGYFKFKMAFIPCGTGSVLVKGVHGSAPITPPPGTNFNWKAVDQQNAAITEIADLPTVVDDYIEFEMIEDVQIGVNLIETPSDLVDPEFRLERLATAIIAPKQVEFAYTNTGGRWRAFDFLVEIGGTTYSTQVESQIQYFYFNDKQWSPGNKGIGPLGTATIKFYIPVDTEERTARVTIIASGGVTSANTITVKILPRTITRYPAVFQRDLVDSRMENPTAKNVVYRLNLIPTGFKPYLYTNGGLVLITWGTRLSNGDRLVCIADDVDAISQVLYHLQNTRGILPHRRHV